jgi:hypothetical protein
LDCSTTKIFYHATELQIDRKTRSTFPPNKKLNLRIKDGFVFAFGCLTVCVTRAGAGGGTPSDWKNDKA